jgi:hypothetical protein
MMNTLSYNDICEAILIPLRRLQPLGLCPRKDQNPQAEACATKFRGPVWLGDPKGIDQEAQQRANGNQY